MGGYSTTNNPTYEFVNNWLYYQIHAAIRRHKDVVFVSGGALGVDQMAASIVLAAKDKYASDKEYTIKHCMVLPCHEHYAKWPEGSQRYVKSLMNRSDTTLYAHNGPYNGPGCLQRRNEIMVDYLYNSESREYVGGLYAVYNGGEGGTRNCMLYAWKTGVPILSVNPETREEKRYRNEKKAKALTGLS